MIPKRFKRKLSSQYLTKKNFAGVCKHDKKSEMKKRGKNKKEEYKRSEQIGYTKKI